MKQMSPQTPDDFRRDIEDCLSEYRFLDALNLMRRFIPANAWTLKDECTAISEDFTRMLPFCVADRSNPSNKAQYSKLLSRMYALLDMTVREANIPDYPSLYYNILRTLRLRKTESLASLIDEYRSAVTAVSPFEVSKLGRREVASRRKYLESIELRLFERLWVSGPLSTDEIALLRSLFEAEEVLPETKLMLVSALTMSLLQFFDERNLLLLLQLAAASPGEEIEVRAAVGALLVMSHWPLRSNSGAIQSAIDSMREKSRWQDDLYEATLQILRMSNVEKISSTIRDEILPDMMKMKSRIGDNIMDSEGYGLNPEWEDALEKSGLADRLRKLSDMQMQGGDMFYPLFSMLKSDAFFSPIANWFRPFDAEHSDVADALGHDVALGLQLAESSAMCDSDKFSFVLSLNRLPEAQKQMVLTQLSQASIPSTGELSGGRREIIVRYVQDLYRFFRLFRRKGEFFNPFNEAISPVTVPVLEPDFSDPDKLLMLAEFYFKNKHFRQALDVFNLLPPDARMHQKMGYAFEKLGDYKNALAQYQRAELLDENSEWTLRHLAGLHSRIGDFGQAVESYIKLEKILPEDTGIALKLAGALLETEQFHEALNRLYKVEIFDENNPRAFRMIAHALFLSKDYDKAALYYQKLAALDGWTSEDSVNMALVDIARGNIAPAVDTFRNIAVTDFNLESFILPKLTQFRRLAIPISLFDIRIILDYAQTKNND